jgi:hypothetical protein
LGLNEGTVTFLLGANRRCELRPEPFRKESREELRSLNTETGIAGGEAVFGRRIVPPLRLLLLTR